MRKFNLLLSGLFCLLFVSNLNAQNPVWSLPPDYYDGFNIQSLPTVQYNNSLPSSHPINQSYHGDPAELNHNAMSDKNGNLEFFVIDDKVYDEDGYLIGRFKNFNTTNIYFGYVEISIVPDPDDCSRYFIITTGGKDDGFVPYYAVVDMAQPNPNFSGRNGALKENLSGNTIFTMGDPMNPDYESTSYHFTGDPKIAVTKPRSDNSVFIFIESYQFFYRYKIENGVLTYDNYRYLTSGNSPGFSERDHHELELYENPNNTYTLVSHAKEIHYVGQDYVGLGVNQLSANGVVTSRTIYLYSNNLSNLDLSDKVYLKGVEFSPNGRIIYLSFDYNASGSKHHLHYLDLDNPSNGIQLYTGTSQDHKFKNSQIESDGQNLYLAHSNGLAKIQYPNSPGATNFTLNFLNFSYPSSNMSSTHFSLADPVGYFYALPDQIDGMDYPARFFANEACCIEYAQYDQLSFSANENIDNDWTPTSNPLNNGSGATATVRDQIVIPPGHEITITDMNIEFAPGGRLIVERGNPGGRLVLNNTTLTVNNSCGSDFMWLGVQVLGYNNVLPGTSQGRLIINSSTIENAHIGIAATKILPDPNNPHTYDSYLSGYNGGIVKAVNSTFKNNVTDVELNQYNFDNESYFTKCAFITDAELNNSNFLPQQHVRLKNVQDVSFSGSTFSNTHYSGAEKGVGIFSSNSKFGVSAWCSSVLCNNAIKSEFNNLKFGIYANSSNSQMSAYIDRTKFINTNFGAILLGMNGAEVLRSTFEILPSTSSSINYAYHYGLFLGGSSDYNVEANEFSNYNNSITSTPTYGVIVISSGEVDNEIYRNDFHDLHIGVQAQGINAEDNGNNTQVSTKGLEILCNDFYSDIIDADIAVTSGRIDGDQGDCVPSSAPNAQKFPAGNKFSHTGNNATNDIHANSSVNYFEYAHHIDNITTPIDYSSNIVTTQNCTDLTFNESAACPSKIGGGVIITDPPLVFFREKIDSLEIVIGDKKDLIDGNNTQELIDFINNPEIDPYGNLEDASPYLSDEVLVAYVNSNPDEAPLVDIIVSNSPLRDSVLNEIDLQHLSEDARATILDYQTGVSERSYLYSEIELSEQEQKSFVDAMIQYSLHDDTTGHGMDTIISVLENKNQLSRKMQLCEAYIANGDSVKAVNILDSIVVANSSSLATDLLDIMIDLRAQQSVANYLDSNEAMMSQVKTIANNTDDLTSAFKAKSILSTVLDTIYTPKVEPLIPEPEKMMLGNSGGNNQEQEKMMKIYPNPSGNNNSVTIEAEMDDLQQKSKVLVKIYSITGKKLIQQRLSQNGKLFKVNINKLKTGLYFVNLIQSGQKMETQKLIITKR